MLFSGGSTSSASSRPPSWDPAARKSLRAKQESSRSAGASRLDSGLRRNDGGALGRLWPKPHCHYPLTLQRSASGKSPIRARPEAIDSNWSADISLSPPKRVANSACTAGTKEVPPVRKTRSISAGVRRASASATSTVAAMRSRSGRIQASKSARAISAPIIDALLAESEFDFCVRRQRQLGRRDGTGQRQAEVELDQGDEILERTGIARGPWPVRRVRACRNCPSSWPARSSDSAWHNSGSAPGRDLPKER